MQTSIHTSVKHPRKNYQHNPVFNRLKRKMRFPYRICMLLCLVFGLSALQGAWATNYTSNVASGSWNTAASWFPNGVPGPNDNVTIQNAHKITLASDITCASLTIQSMTTAGSSESSLSLNGYILTLNSITLNSNGGQRSAKLNLGSGTLRVSGTISFIGTTSNITLPYTTGGIEFYDLTTPTPLSLSASGITFPNLTFNKAQVALASNISTNGNIIIQSGIVDNANFSIIGTSGKNLEIKSGATFKISGTSSFPSIFTPVLNTGSTVEYAGGNQTIAVLPYSNLILSGSGTKTPSGPITLDRAMSIADGNILDLANGSVTLRDYDLTIQQTGSISGYSLNNYIKQTGSGKLIKENIGTGGGITTEVLFPVGTATSYTPAYITNAGPKDKFSVNVADNVTDNFGTLVTINVVKKTWNVVQETTTGTANVTLRLQWNTSDEGSPFDRTQAGISHYFGNTWHQPATFISATAGTQPNTYSMTLSGLDHFSPFGVGDINSPLPAELTYFEATKKETGAFLQWTTASEKNNAGFYIQASADGKNFEDIGFVASHNPNAAVKQQYDFLDKASRTGLQYYRLKQADLDGKLSYSAIKAVNFEARKQAPLIYPNPFNEQISVSIEAGKNEELRYQLIDITGKTVCESNQKLTKGNNMIRINLPEQYPAGVYLLRTQTSGSILYTRLLRQ